MQLENLFTLAIGSAQAVQVPDRWWSVAFASQPGTSEHMLGLLACNPWFKGNALNPKTTQNHQSLTGALPSHYSHLAMFETRQKALRNYPMAPPMRTQPACSLPATPEKSQQQGASR